VVAIWAAWAAWAAWACNRLLACVEWLSSSRHKQKTPQSDEPCGVFLLFNL
jgi:hypothetical protein